MWKLIAHQQEVATKEANCDWFTIFLNMAHFLPKQRHKNPNSFCLKGVAGPSGVRRLHKYRLWYFGKRFPNIEYWECASKANNWLLYRKKWKLHCQHRQKTHIFVRKIKIYLKKTLNNLEKLHPDFSKEGREERPARHAGVFCQSLGITAYTLENYSNFKSKFSFNNVLEIHYYFRTRGNASFNDLSQLINTLSNQDFAGLNKFRLRESLGKMKEIRVKINRINRSNRNKSSTSDFFSSPFSPVKLWLEHVFLSYSTWCVYHDLHCLTAC